MTRNRNIRTSWMMAPIGALAVLAALGIYLGQQSPARAADQEEMSVLAEVGTVEITLDEVEADLASDLQRLNRERHELLERGMEQAIERRLIDLEAAGRSVSRQDLLSQIYADVAEPSEEAVDAFYESRKAQINKPKEEVAAQIINYLRQQDRQATYETFMKDVRERYTVKRYLEPIRIEIAESDSPSMGPGGAPVTIVEFSDFQCPYCKRHAPTLAKIVAAYGDQVQLVFRQFPLPIHSNAQKAAEASLCAADGGKFWEMHDRMFEDIGALSVLQLKEAAAGLDLDVSAFGECLDSGKYASQVATDAAVGREAGVTGTPAMFINGRFVSGAVPYEQIATMIDDELKRESRQ